MDRGILYVATGDKYINEVIESVQSLRTHMSDLPVTLLSDKYVDHPELDQVELLNDPDYTYADGIVQFDDLPYERTLRLDSDIRFLYDVSELFEVLDQFDFGATVNPSPRFYEQGDPTYVSDDVPNSFPLVNGGVLMFKKNERVKDMLELWENIYYSTLDENEREFNQPSLREAVYKSNVRYFPITPEYNCYIDLPGSLDGKVKMIHGRHPDIEAAANELNKTEDPRVHTRNKWPMNVETGGLSNYFRLRRSLDHRGMLGTVKEAFRQIMR